MFCSPGRPYNSPPFTPNYAAVCPQEPPFDCHPHSDECSPHHHTISWRSILIVSYQPRLNLVKLWFSNYNFLCPLHVSHACYMPPVPNVYLMTLGIGHSYGEEKLWNCLLQPAITLLDFRVRPLSKLDLPLSGILRRVDW